MQLHLGRVSGIQPLPLRIPRHATLWQDISCKQLSVKGHSDSAAPETLAGCENAAPLMHWQTVNYCKLNSYEVWML